MKLTGPQRKVLNRLASNKSPTWVSNLQTTLKTLYALRTRGLAVWTNQADEMVRKVPNYYSLWKITPEGIRENDSQNAKITQ